MKLPLAVSAAALCACLSAPAGAAGDVLSATATFYDPATGAVVKSVHRRDTVGYRLRGNLPEGAIGQKAHVTVEARLAVSGIVLPYVVSFAADGLVKNPARGGSPIEAANRLVEGTFVVPTNVPNGTYNLTLTVDIESVGSVSVIKNLKVVKS